MSTSLKYLIPLGALLTIFLAPAAIPEAGATRHHSSVSVGIALQNHTYSHPRWRHSRAFRPHFRSHLHHFPAGHLHTWNRYPHYYHGLGSRAYAGAGIPFGYVVVEAPEVQFQLPLQPQRTYPASDLVVEVNRTHMRSGPGDEYPVTGQAYSGQPLTIAGETPEWYYVQHPHGHYGWVLKSHTRPTGDTSDRD